MKPSSMSMRDMPGTLHRPKPALRAGQLVGGGVSDDPVLGVDPDDGRLPAARLVFVARLGEGREDHDVAGLGVVRGGAVHADEAGAGRPLQRVGLEAATVGGVPYVDALVCK